MIGNDWDLILKEEYSKEYFKDLNKFLEIEYKTKEIYPLKEDLYNALKITPYSSVSVVILGQDPYHGVGEAHGLSFSVKNGIKMPPSLRNIFKELKSDLNISRTNTDLTDWAKQGVLLLNSVMTVRKDSPLSHKEKGWEILTDKIIEMLGKSERPIVFILMGNHAKSKKKLIQNNKQFIIETVHPSPLSASRGFMGSKIFSRTNGFLEKNKKNIINWQEI